jgi:hypothetical protein
MKNLPCASGKREASTSVPDGGRRAAASLPVKSSGKLNEATNLAVRTASSAPDQSLSPSPKHLLANCAASENSMVLCERLLFYLR